MTTLTTIDLSKLALPTLIDTLSFEELLAIIKADLKQYDATLDIDNLPINHPIINLLKVIAHREVALRERINDAANALLLATATGDDLDNLVALFNVQRQQIEAGNPDAIPPTEPIFEGDEQLRRRAQLVFESFSTAGTEGSYLFHALSATHVDDRGNIDIVKDALVYSDLPGEVDIRILSNTGDGTASPYLLANVEAIVNEIAPISDMLTISSARIVPYVIDAQISVYPHENKDIVETKARRALTEYVQTAHRLAGDVTLSGITAALCQSGVQNVVLYQPTEDLLMANDQAAYIDLDNSILLDFVYYQKIDGLPTELPESVSLADTDNMAGCLTGTLALTAANDESTITHYAIYWGRNSRQRLSNQAIITLPATGDSTLTYALKPNLQIPKGATHVLAFSANAVGEMDECVNLEILDKAIPVHKAEAITLEQAIINQESKTIVGIVNINSATQDTDITRYNLYWAKSTNEKIETNALIESFDKHSSLRYQFTTATAIPAQATHLLVLTENKDGEMREGSAVELIAADNVKFTEIPKHKSTGIYFNQAQRTGDTLSGTIKIMPAINESDITHYNVYWGKNAVEKIADNALLERFEKTSALEKIYTTEQLIIPNEATHFLVFTENTIGEMLDGISESIIQ